MKNPTEQQIDDFICEIHIKSDSGRWYAEALLKDGNQIATASVLGRKVAMTVLKDLVAEILEAQP